MTFSEVYEVQHALSNGLGFDAHKMNEFTVRVIEHTISSEHVIKHAITTSNDEEGAIASIVSIWELRR